MEKSEEEQRNHYSVGEAFTTESVVDWAFFDLLPPNVRAMVREARFEYSGVQIYTFWDELKKEWGQDHIVESRMRQAILANDNELKRIGDQFYRDLVDEMRREKQERIMNIFQRAN